LPHELNGLILTNKKMLLSHLFNPTSRIRRVQRL
jgi:hypothetical protein